jgi:hypothetical protein
MAAQEYYDSFKLQPVNNHPLESPFKAKPQPTSQSYKNGGGASVPYPNPPYPTTPDPTPQRRNSPYPTQPHSQQYLAPPNIESSYFPRPSRAGSRPSDAYAYPGQAPIATQRSTSEPPDNRRVSLSSAGGRPPRRTYRNSRDDSSDYDDSDPSRSRSRDRSHSSHRQHHDRHRSTERSRNSRNTFLGAGGGAIVGDAIFPGLGTLGGLLIGGWGGHEYSKRRSKSEGKYDDSRPKNGRGRNGSYRDGVTVRSEWGLIER